MTRILGIDPGSQRTGIGIIDVDAAGKTTHVYHAPLVLLGDGDFPLRLRRLLDGLGEAIATWQPDEVAIEKVFMARNPDSALKLGQARGAAICAAVLRDLPVHEYAAKEVKLAVVGRGSAEKTQIQHMVGIMLNLHGKLQADAADALAVAIAHHQGRLEIAVENDGAPETSTLPPKQRGLNALSGRAQALGGNIRRDELIKARFIDRHDALMQLVDL